MSSERRILGSKMTLRSAGGAPKLVGYAAVFNRDSELLDGSFIERIAPGAFAESIARPDDVRALVNHEPTLILGRNLSGTLQLQEDSHGLLSTITPPKTSYAHDILESTRRGDISQMSFGFQTITDRWERGMHGRPDVRTLLKVRLFDVSVVTYPAYPDTDVAVRSHQSFLSGHSETAHGVYEPSLAMRRLRLLNEIVDLPLSGNWPDGTSDLIAGRRRLLDIIQEDHARDERRFRQLEIDLRRLELDRLLWEPSESQRAGRWLYDYLNAKIEAA
ncbi:MAG: hypothetical protein A4E19_05945 [Nitrospira sp. SG-bin1]|nr:MAG: hypothetical protein A4E19_05945 [Nitrospira sp. SG-bin1]